MEAREANEALFFRTHLICGKRQNLEPNKIDE